MSELVNRVDDANSVRNDRPTVGPTIAVVIPVLDEEEAIGSVLSRLSRTLISEVIVVDGGSRDRTCEVAWAAGATVLVEPRPGYGRACASGALAAQSDVVVFLDGDGSDDATAVERIVAPLVRGDADLVLGVRQQVEPGVLPIYARAGNALAAAIISLVWGQRVTDLPSYKAIRRRDLGALDMTEMTYGWTTELIVKAARQRLRIREISLVYRQRVGGESKVSGNPRASVKAAIAILRVLARHSFGRAPGHGEGSAISPKIP